METTILILFVVGYVLISIEHVININKTAIALITGILCWTLYALTHSDKHLVTHQLFEVLSDVSSILFFLIGAMTIVELMDAHGGFDLINRMITTRNSITLTWVISLITFFLSAVLDNLTTTLVMVMLTARLIQDPKSRIHLVGLIIIAANAGGAWSPIGDVTTTMLWIGGQASPSGLITNLFLPSLINLIVPLCIVSFFMKKETFASNASAKNDDDYSPFEKQLIFFAGVGVLLSVPVFKTITHLPPFMGMMLGLGVLWVITELIHRNKIKEVKQKLSVVQALERMDVPSVLFFLGILLAVGALNAIGILSEFANGLTNAIGNEKIIVSLIGGLSAVVDNVPVVAATTAMYPLTTYPLDHSFWHLLAYCAGTGGSLLIIGSAAGIAAMGIEEISFGWYLKKIAWLAVLGYVAGILVFMLQENFLH